MKEDLKISVRFNEEEQLMLQWLKDFFGFKGVHGEDSQTIKQGLSVAFNVLRSFFGSELDNIFKRKSRDMLLKIRAIQQDRIQKSRTDAAKIHGACQTE